jgi:hypothetical protein
MNTFTDNTFELVKVYYLSEFLALPSNDFAKVMEGYRKGKYDLVVIDEIA